jgi:hypothetical protein
MSTSRPFQILQCSLAMMMLVVARPVFSEIVPPARLGDWSGAGVQGGIPDYPVGVNVMDHGAVGDGAADDTAALQAAIAACPEGEAVFLPAGSYRTTATLVISKSIVLRGAGPGLTYIIHNHSGRAIRVESGGDWAGIEDLHVHTDWSFSSYGGTKIELDGVQSSWIRNIETSGYVGETIYLIGTTHCEVRDSYFHNSQAETLTVPQFRSYGVGLYGGGASHNLVENNVFDWFRHAMILNYENLDNVYAYNFSWNVWTSDGGTSATTDMEFHHYNYDTNSEFISFTLVEGNLFEQGSFNSHRNNTALRNRINNGGYKVRDENNLIGNEFVEKKNPGTYAGIPNSIDSIGTDDIIHGNYVVYGDTGMQWDSSISDHDIPSSYYLTSKPAFFGDLAWPPYGGDLMPGNARRTPAEVRYWTMLFPEDNPPTNLQANAQGNDVVLTWTNNSTNTVDFIVCRSLDNVHFERIAETAQTTYTDPGATGQDYHYYVRARNHLGGKNGDDLGGESDPSNTVSAASAAQSLSVTGCAASEGSSGSSTCTFDVTLQAAP